MELFLIKCLEVLLHCRRTDAAPRGRLQACSCSKKRANGCARIFKPFFALSSTPLPFSCIIIILYEATLAKILKCFFVCPPNKRLSCCFAAFATSRDISHQCHCCKCRHGYCTYFITLCDFPGLSDCWQVHRQRLVWSCARGLRAVAASAHPGMFQGIHMLHLLLIVG